MICSAIQTISNLIIVHYHDCNIQDFSAFQFQTQIQTDAVLFINMNVYCNGCQLYCKSWILFWRWRPGDVNVNANIDWKMKGDMKIVVSLRRLGDVRSRSILRSTECHNKSASFKIKVIGGGKVIKANIALLKQKLDNKATIYKKYKLMGNITSSY